MENDMTDKPMPVCSTCIFASAHTTENGKYFCNKSAPVVVREYHGEPICVRPVVVETDYCGDYSHTYPEPETLRDKFAGKVLIGISISYATQPDYSDLDGEFPEISVAANAANMAYLFADAMLAERGKS